MKICKQFLIFRFIVVFIQEEAVAAMGKTDNKLSGEDILQDRSE